MKRVVPLFALMTLGMVGPAAAQACRLLCTPVFVGQPGIIIANAINPPELAPGVEAESSTEFLFRVTTVIPTQIPRTTLVGIVQWTPFAETDDFTANAPAFIYGPVFTLFRAGPLTTTFDVLGLYAPSATATAAYRHELLLEFDVGLSLGTMMGPTAPSFLRAVSLYGFIAQQVTNVPRDFEGERTYSPLLLFGLTIPIAPLP